MRGLIAALIAALLLALITNKLLLDDARSWEDSYHSAMHQLSACQVANRPAPVEGMACECETRWARTVCACKAVR